MSRQEIDRLLDEAYKDSFEECIGCGGFYPLEMMNPITETEWCCKPCYYSELEGIPV